MDKKELIDKLQERIREEVIWEVYYCSIPGTVADQATKYLTELLDSKE